MELQLIEYYKITCIFNKELKGIMRPTIIVLIALCVSFCSAQGPMMQPKLLSQRAPDYPEAAKKLRMEGKVLLNAHIGIDGKVKGNGVCTGCLHLCGKDTRDILFGRTRTDRSCI
jgi:hypothetical protein